MPTVEDVQTIRRDIDLVSWDQLFHGYGTAQDTAEHLRDLVAGCGVRPAAAHLGSAIVHQATVWPATADALRIACSVLVTVDLPVEAVDGIVAALAEAGHVMTLDLGPERGGLPSSAREAFFESRRLAAEDEADDEVALWPGDAEPVVDEVGEIVVEILFSEYPEAADAWMRDAGHRVRALAPVVLRTLDELAERGVGSCDVVKQCRVAWLGEAVEDAA